MKVFWLNSEMTEAIVEKGALWWKRRATVRRDHFKFYFVPSGREPERWLCRWLEERFLAVLVARRREEEEAEGNWQPVAALPDARVAKT